MRLCPFTPKEPLPDTVDHPAQQSEDPGALSEQALVDNHVPLPKIEHLR